MTPAPRPEPLPPEAAAPPADRYGFATWSEGAFGVNAAGHVEARPLGADGPAIDLHRVAETLRESGVALPVVVRFQDLLAHRVRLLHGAFADAIAEAGYGGGYQAVYPIKVNQLREVVEELLEAGAPFSYGLEAGSKAELVAALPYVQLPDALLLCNGFKDAEMLRLMLMGQRLGQRALPIIERYWEFETLLRLGAEVGVEPRMGARVRLSAHGEGLWAESGGDRSKFGLLPTELLRLCEVLERRGRRDALRLLHAHLGSQLGSLRPVGEAARELTRVYAELHRRGFAIELLDLGGGLGVPYSSGGAPGSLAYSVGDYARAVVAAVHQTCAEEGVPEPTLVTESGRFVAAPHSVLVTEVVGVRRAGGPAEPAPEVPEGAAPPLQHLGALLAGADEADPATAAEEAEYYLDQADQAFLDGRLDLETKALAQRLHAATGRALAAAAARRGEPLPDALAPLVTDQYLCDFSVFRSLLDHLLVGQRFPIAPLHRLHEPATRRGVLVDLTCDSDGHIDRFVTADGDQDWLALHEPEPDRPYYVGFFLVGAYQDIMGDMHNLFGRVGEAHVYADADEPDGFYVEEILPGDSVEGVLQRVQYFPNDLERRMARLVRQAVQAGRIRPRTGVRLLHDYRATFRSYTYFDTEGGGA